MIDGYINISEAAEKWGISTRRVQVLCKNGRIEGAAISFQLNALSYLMELFWENMMKTEKL